MAIALLVGRDAEGSKQFDWFIKDWQNCLLQLQPDLDIRIWPNIGDPNDVTFALVWQHPLGVLNNFPNLKAIASLGAGVDHVLVDSHLPKQVPIVRVVDPHMANDIVQYVTVCVLDQIKRMGHWRELQQQKQWLKKPPFNFSEKTIGIMGLGFLGSKAVTVLESLGINVVGWSNSPKDISIKHYIGEQQFHEFLTQSHILVCMLPLTTKTKNILNRNTFSYLPDEAYVINVGRGEHLVEEDLLSAIESGKLSGASLDVFNEEPLPENHPFWTNKKIRVTPHIASVTNPATVAPQMLENYRHLLTNKDLLNLVDLQKGY